MDNKKQSHEFPLTSKSGKKPLEGLRVIDAGNMVAAPFATVLLADLGAEVINGDESDLRFTDPMGKIVGLIFKKSAASEKDSNGFVRATKTVALS